MFLFIGIIFIQLSPSFAKYEEDLIVCSNGVFNTVMVSGTLRSGMPPCIPLQSVALQWKVLRRTMWMIEFL